MAEHLSNLALDELAATLPGPPAAHAHLDACEGCRTRYERLVAERRRSVESPRYEQVLARLASRAQVPPPRRRAWALYAPALAAAAGLFALVLVFRPPPEDSVRIKGSASVRFLRAPDGAAVSSAVPQDRVVLAVSGAGRPYALVLAVDEGGEVSQLWPQRANQSGRLPEGAEARLQPGFEVTQGSLAVHAFFGDEPLDAPAARAQLEREVASARAQGKSPLEATATPNQGAARAVARLSVEEPR